MNTIKFACIALSFLPWSLSLQGADALSDFASPTAPEPTPSPQAQAAEKAEAPEAITYLEESASVVESPQARNIAEGPQKTQWEAEFAGGIAAVVKIIPSEKDKDNEGTRIITVEEVRREMTPFIAQVRRDSPTEEAFQSNINALSRQVTQNLIDRYLILEDARSEGVKVPDAYFKNFFDNQLAEQFHGDRALYQEYLRSMGQTDLEFKKEMEEQLIVDYMRSMRQKSLGEVSPQKVQAYYEAHKQNFAHDASVHLKQIMLAPGQEAQAQEILKRLAQGESFSKLAQEYSQDDKGKLGGDWGWVSRTDIRPELAQVAFELPLKSYSSQPIEIKGTLFILYVDDKRDAGVAPFNEVRQKIEQLLANELMIEAQEKYLKTLRKKASVSYLL